MLSAWNRAIENLPEYELISLVKNAALKNAPAWKVGKVMGYWSEALTEELVKTLREPLEKTIAGKQLMSELANTRDQIFISIEDGYFSTPHAKPGIIKEIWFYDNEYSRKLISTIRYYYGLETNSDDIKRVSAALKAIDGEPGGKSLLKVICS